jgi:hypothetical protein
MSKPKVFIGSSSEATEIALAIQNGLSGVADVDVWSQGMFRAGTIPFEVLERAVDGFDFAIFVFAKDDVLKMRNQSFAAVRDNVVFELGLFIGKLGRERSVFVVPRGAEDLHLPSDLSGVTPATFDMEENKMEKVVANACFQVRQILKELGPLHHESTVLFNGSQPDVQAFLEGVEGRIYKDKDPVSEKGRGTLTVNSDGCLIVARSNTDGRFQIQLRPKGPKKPSFLKSYSPPPRLVHISCEAKSEGGEHTLRFVLKDEERDEWLANEKKKIDGTDWIPLNVYLWIDSTRDCLFRIDDVTAKAPSKVMIRRLTISEKRA